VVVTLEQFVQQLTASGLMSASEVTSFQGTLPPPRPKDAESLARELVQANKLTRYQAASVYQGRGKGLMFGEYRVLDKLGQGGMGVVLKAEHRRMKRLVAVKMIAGAAMKSPDAVKRFYREVEAAAKLNHPNIVQAHDASEHEGVHYLVMEFVEGKDLAAIVKEKGPLPIAQAVECIVQAARGLEYAHKQGIVHRDIKPANLLVDKEGTVKILDMGLARVAGLSDQDDRDRLTASGQVMGTCDYMAPEQALDTHTADRRADIYALGCTLYRLLTGEVLYKGESLVQILLGHQQSPIPSLRTTRSEVSPQLDAIYQKMVAKKPDDRQQTMAEVIADLERCMGRRSGAAQALAEQSSVDDQALQDALSFLKEGGVGAATLAKKKPAPSQSRTIACQPGQGEHGHAERSGHSERSEESPSPRRQPRFFAALRMTRSAAVGLGLLSVAVLIALAVTVRIRQPDGQQTIVQVPEGSKVKVSQRGDVDVAIEAERPRDDSAPAFKGGFDPNLAAQTQPATSKPSSSLIGPEDNGSVPPDARPPAVVPFFVSLFDGKTLDGWDGDPRLWRVEDGCITGETTPENQPPHNTFLIWRGGKPIDFELKVEFRMPNPGASNSGVQFRSWEGPERWKLSGYQADIDAGNKYTGAFYGENFGGLLATRGQRVTIAPDKRKNTETFADSLELGQAIKANDWNELRIVAQGKHIRQEINGRLMSELNDESTADRANGIIALQIHAKWPMKAQFRKVLLKELGPAAIAAPSPDISQAKASPAPEEKFFLGKWDCTGGFVITLNADYTALKTTSRPRGHWQYVNGEARITWEDGIHNTIRRDGDGFQKLFWKAGVSPESPPQHSRPARKQEGG
jgi:serine/threonine protein kinase